jgi:acetyl esterase/lipase
LAVLFWTLAVVLVRRLVRGARYSGWTFRQEAIAELMRHETERTVGLLAAGKPALLLETPLHRKLLARMKHEREPIAGVSCEVHTPNGWRTGDPVVLYLHGGGYVTCTPGTHRELIARLAVEAGARCVAPNYRKAPLHPFPAGIDDCVGVYSALIASGVRPDQLIIAGDSAGGGLTLATLLRVRTDGNALPAGAVLLSPWVDLEFSGASILDNARYDYLQPGGLRVAAKLYLGGEDPRHPLASPVHADLSGLPPLLIHTGNAELFHDENHRLAERARAAGVHVSHHIGKGMVHVWHLFASLIPEGVESIRAAAAFVRERTRQTVSDEVSALAGAARHDHTPAWAAALADADQER